MKKSIFLASSAVVGVVAAATLSFVPALAQDAQQIASSGPETVVVTAEKREENLQDVPVPVTVLSGSTLAENDQVQVRDYFSTVPGLSATSGIYAGANTLLSIRGINSGSANPTVGILIDDVPYGSSYGGHAGGGDLPDIDPADLARIEVLRGPQGTLYGADSMGGLIKFVTKEPSSDGFSGQIEAGTNSVSNGAEPGFSIRGSLNIPVSDTVAVRVSGFDRQDAGYIDNVNTGVNGVNEGEASGGRFAALWKPSEFFSLKLNALYQKSRTNGSPDTVVQPGLGDLQQNYIPGVGGYDRTVQFYSAVANAKLANIDVTSITGYNVGDTSHSLDYSGAFAGIAESEFNIAAAGVPFYNINNISKISQEVRVSSTLFDNLDWLVGGYYTQEREYDKQFGNVVSPTTGALIGTNLYQGYFNGDNFYREYSGYFNLVYHFTPAFDIEAGLRVSQIETNNAANYIVFAGLTSVNPASKISNTPLTYLVTPRYKLSDDLMVYARFASGFRPGGANTPGADIPPEVNPDTTRNYEVGLKGDFLDHLISIDTSVYYIQFNDMQVTLLNGGIFYQANAGQAKSEGVELALTARPWDGLTMNGWIAYDNAALTSGFPAGNAAIYGVTGNELPYTSRWSGNFSLQQNFPLWGTATGFVGGLVDVVGDRVGNFQATPTRQIFPTYTRIDLHAGVQYDSWSANAYINNVGDVRGILGGGLDGVPTNAFTYIQPRTIGIDLVQRF